jgi:hypothetical protein
VASRQAALAESIGLRIRQYTIGSGFADRLRQLSKRLTGMTVLGEQPTALQTRPRLPRRLSDHFVNQLLAHRKACRQLDDKSGPAEGRFVVGSNDPIMRFNDRLSDRQAQSHAGLLGRKKAVEQTRQMLSVDAGAAILDEAAHRLRVDLLRSNGSS